MGRRRRVCRIRCQALFRGKLAQQRVHREVPGGILALQERLVDQGQQQVEIGPRHLRRGDARESAAKDTQTAQARLFPAVEHLPRPGENDAHAALAGRHIGQVGMQEIETGFDFGSDLGRREQREPGSGQNQPQRDSLNQAADADHGGDVVSRQRKIAPLPASAVNKELYGGKCQGLLRCRCGGEAEPVQFEAVFAGQIQALTRRYEQDQRRAVPQNVIDQSFSFRQVLEVVEDEQHPTPAQVLEELWLERSAVVGRPKIHGCGNGQRDLVRQRQGYKVHEEDAVAKLRQQRGAGCQRQARLADAAGADDADQPLVIGRDQVHDLGHLLLAAD